MKKQYWIVITTLLLFISGCQKQENTNENLISTLEKYSFNVYVSFNDQEYYDLDGNSYDSQLTKIESERILYCPEYKTSYIFYSENRHTLIQVVTDITDKSYYIYFSNDKGYYTHNYQENTEYGTLTGYMSEDCQYDLTNNTRLTDSPYCYESEIKMAQTIKNDFYNTLDILGLSEKELFDNINILTRNQIHDLRESLLRRYQKQRTLTVKQIQKALNKKGCDITKNELGDIYFTSGETLIIFAKANEQLTPYYLQYFDYMQVTDIDTCYLQVSLDEKQSFVSNKSASLQFDFITDKDNSNNWRSIKNEAYNLRYDFFNYLFSAGLSYYDLVYFIQNY